MVRSWILAQAVQASGPADPIITFVAVASPEVLGLGFCPAAGEGVPLDNRLTIYRLGERTEVVPIEAIPIARPGESENVLFRPTASGRSPAPSDSAREPERWPSGRYVMQIDGPDGFQRWLGLEIQILEAEVPL